MSSEHHNQAAPTMDLPLPSPPPPTSGGETGSNDTNSYRAGVYKKMKHPNPPDTMNPDAETLREQWQYATKKYSRWYGRTWGSAVLVGAALYGIGWWIKGSNPLPSLRHNCTDNSPLQAQPSPQFSA